MKAILLLITCIALVGCSKRIDKADEAAYRTQLSAEQKREVLLLLARTNELDRLYRMGEGAGFKSALASIDEEAAAIQPPLPQSDIAAQLFANVLKAYRDATPQGAGAIDSLPQAQVRKELARKVIRGTLTDQEKEALQKMVANDQAR